jgi:hypothetical protein
MLVSDRPLTSSIAGSITFAKKLLWCRIRTMAAAKELPQVVWHAEELGLPMQEDRLDREPRKGRDDVVKLYADLRRISDISDHEASKVTGAKPRAAARQAGCPRQRIRYGSGGTEGPPQTPSLAPR